MTLSVASTLRKQAAPKIDFKIIKDEILGKNYELSLLFCASSLAKKINYRYRNKDYSPNTLSFRYNDGSGEIIINLELAKKEAKEFGHSYKEHVLFLYIHSLLHLRGFTHGYKMEKTEKLFFEKFKKKNLGYKTF